MPLPIRMMVMMKNHRANVFEYIFFFLGTDVLLIALVAFMIIFIIENHSIVYTVILYLTERVQRHRG